MKEPAWIVGRHEEIGPFRWKTSKHRREASARQRRAPGYDENAYAILEGVALSERVWNSIVANVIEMTDTTPRPSGCWLWKGPLNSGYGYVDVRGFLKRAHRVSYAIAVGPIPYGLVIRHGDTCESRACVRPSHLTPGTQRENIMDMIRVGRWRPFGRAAKRLGDGWNCGELPRDPVVDAYRQERVGNRANHALRSVGVWMGTPCSVPEAWS